MIDAVESSDKYDRMIDDVLGPESPPTPPPKKDIWGRAIYETVLPVAGGMAGAGAGAIAGAPLGPVGAAVGALGGAYIGGAAARAMQLGAEQAANLAFPGAFPTPPPTEVLADVSRTGMAQATGQALGMGATAGLQALKPSAIQLAAQIERATTGVPERFAANLWQRAKQVSKAMPWEASPLYQSAMKGLKGLGDYGRETLKKRLLSPDDIPKIFNDAADALEAGTITPQQALAGVQSANRLQIIAGSRTAESAEHVYNIPKYMEYEVKFKDFLEKNGYPIVKASQDYFDGLTKKAYASTMPLNKNQSANALRGFAAVAGAAGAAYDLAAGEAGRSAAKGLLLPFLVSPQAHYLAIRGATTLAPAIGTTLGIATWAGLQVAADKREYPPETDFDRIYTGLKQNKYAKMR